MSAKIEIKFKVLIILLIIKPQINFASLIKILFYESTV